MERPTHDRRASISGIRSRNDENRRPEETDAIYADAVRRANAYLSRAGDSRLLDENVQYGFRRNLLALKPFALSILAVVVISNGFLTFELNQWVAGASIMVLALVDALLWLIVVREAWVREQAETFAQRFFDSVAASPR